MCVRKCNICESLTKIEKRAKTCKKYYTFCPFCGIILNVKRNIKSSRKPVFSRALCTFLIIKSQFKLKFESPKIKKIKKIQKRGCNSYGAMLIYNSVITEAVMRTWLHGQAVKTLASHAGIRGSIPLGVTFERVSAEEFCGYFFA